MTTAAFHSFAVGRSSFGAPTSTPNLAKLSSASFSANAVCTHAFVGMQPTRRQVPPSSGSCSMQTAVRAELRGADRGGVAARAASEDGDVAFHASILSTRVKIRA